MLYPDFGMLFAAAILSCHDMNILFMIVMPIAVLLLIVSLILNMTMIFMPAAVSGYAYYFSWLFLTSSLFLNPPANKFVGFQQDFAFSRLLLFLCAGLKHLFYLCQLTEIGRASCRERVCLYV